MPELQTDAVDDLKRRARRRLVGAVVLALAAAVILPMFLESDPKPLGKDVQIDIPPVDNSRFVSRLTPREAQPVSAPADAAQAGPAPTAPAPSRSMDAGKPAEGAKMAAPPPVTAAPESAAKVTAPLPKAETKAEAKAVETKPAEPGPIKSAETKPSPPRT